MLFRKEIKLERDLHVSNGCSLQRGALCLRNKSNNKDTLIAIFDHHNTNYRVSTHNINLNFVKGEKICFMFQGKGEVHLTGYYQD